MKRHFKDEGLIIKKLPLADEDLLVTVFSSSGAKMTFRGYGVKKLTSRRLSHFEIGNYIHFSYYKKDDRAVLGETELLYGHSKIKQNNHKVNVMFLLFFVLNKILPEDQYEENIFKLTANFLRDLNNHEIFSVYMLKAVFDDILVLSGFITRQKISEPTFDTIAFVEGLIGYKLSPQLALIF